MDEIRGKIINVFDAWERGGFKGDSGIIDTFISQKKGKSKLTPELFSQFEIFKEEFNNSSLSAEALGEKMKNVDSRIISYAKTCKNGELTTKGFKQSLDDLFYSAKTNAGSAVNQVFQATGNIILDTLISKGLTLAYTAIDNLVHKTEKAKERIQEANNTYHTSKSELQSLQAEFSATTQRINELNSKGKLSFTDKSELETLNTQNAELEHSVELSEIKNKLVVQDTIDTINDDYDDARKDYKELESNENTKQRIKLDIEAVEKEIEKAEQSYEGDNLTRRIAEKQGQLIQYKKDLADYENAAKEAAMENKEKYFDNAAQLENWIQAYEDKGINNLTQREAETYNQMVSDLNLIYNSILNDEEYIDLKIRPIFEAEKFNGLYEQMISYFKNGGNIEGLSEVFGADIIKALKAACRDNGIEFTQLLNVMHNTASNEPLGMSFAPITKNPNNATDARINQESKDKINYYNSLSEDTQSAIDSGMISLSVDDSLEQCKAKVAEWENTLENNYTSIQLTTNISNIKNDLDSLMNAYTDFANGKNIDISNLAILNDSFGGLSEFSDFIETVTDVTATTEEVQDAFDNLSTAYIDNSDMLNSLNRDKADYIASQLELMGITNSQEFVESRLSSIYGVESQAQKELINISNTLGNAKYNASNASKTLENASLSDIIAMANEASAAGIANSALVSLAMSKASSNGIISSNECSALAALAMQTGYTASAFYELAAAKQAAENGTAKSSGNVYADEKRMQGINANAQTNAALIAYSIKNGNMKTKYSAGGVPNTGGGGGGNNTAASQQKTSINWIERKLERLQKVIDTTKAKFDNLFTVKKKSSNLDTQIKQTKSLLKANEKTAKRYQKYAKNNKLSDSLKKAVREGNYNIKDYNSETADNINKYKEYYDKYKEAQKQADELTAQIRELKEKKYQVYIDDASANIDKLNALSDISTTYQEKNKYLEDQKSHLKTSYDYQIKIAELTKDKVKKEQLQAEYKKELIELQNQEFENIQTYYENQAKLFDHQFTSLDNKISEMETAGKKVSQSYYEEQKKIIQGQKQLYEEEKARLKEQIASIPQGTEEWYDAKDAIQECDNKISDCVESTYELNNAINQLHFDIFDDISESIDRIITEQEFLQDLFAHEKLTDDKTGNFTDAGLAKLGSLSASYYASQKKADNTEKLLKDLQNIKANGLQADGKYKLGDLEFNSLNDLQEKINETYTEWQNDIKDTYSIESDIADLMKEKYQSELDMLQELIDAKKEALQTKKDLHDYQLSIQEETGNISTIRKQIAAYQGDTSQEGLARLQKLQMQLSEKERELEETEYDRYISDQEDMLDKLYTEYEELVTKKLEDFMTLVQEGLETANQNTADISEYMSKVATANGYKIETEGLFDTVIGSIDKSTTTIVDAIINHIKGDALSDNNPDQTENNTPFSSTGYHPLPSIELEKPKLSSLDTETAFSKPVDAVKSSKALTKEDIVNFINKYGTAPKSNGNYGKVNQALQMKYSRVLSSNKMKELSQILGVKNNTKEIYKKLQSLNVPGFKKGGIVSVNHIKKQVHDNGDQVLLSANPGEGILTPDQTAQFEKLVDKLPELNYAVDTINRLDKMPDPTNLTPVGNTTIGDMVFNIDMPNVTNPDEFVKTIQTNQKMQNALRLVTTDRLVGNGKLSVNKIV